MKSPIYWHPFIYNLSMRMLYGKEFEKRYRILAEEIGSSSVLDICCGDCYLANYISSDKYLGMDINSSFVAHGRKKRLRVSQADIVKDEWPSVDCAVMLSSLYQFIPYHEDVLNKAFSVARKKVIISEPISNLVASKNPVIAVLARYSTYPGIESSRERFNRDSLVGLYKKYNVTRVIDVGRELIGVFDVQEKEA